VPSGSAHHSGVVMTIRSPWMGCPTVYPINCPPQEHRRDALGELQLLAVIGQRAQPAREIRRDVGGIEKGEHVGQHDEAITTCTTDEPPKGDRLVSSMEIGLGDATSRRKCERA
jgi:hypothetical protein